MGIASVIKSVTPPGIRHMAGVKLLKTIHTSGGVYFLSLLLDGVPLKTTVKDGICYTVCDKRVIKCPVGGFRTYNEVYHARIYERMGGPKEGDIVLDLGAYVGMFSHRASNLVGEKGKVIAIEPNNDNVLMVRENLKELPNVHVLNVAVSDVSGECKLYISPNSACHSIVHPDSDNYDTVPSMTVDYIVEKLKLPKVDFIKIDIEGAGMMALNGAEKTLRDNKNVKLSIACYHALPNGKPERGTIATHLVERGFDISIKQECLYAGRSL